LHYQRTQTTPTPQKKASAPACEMLATTIHKSNTTPHHQSRATTTKLPRRKPTPNLRVCLSPVSQDRDEEIAGLLSQSPIVCLVIPSPKNPAQRLNPVPAQRLLCTRPPPTTGERAIHRFAPSRGDPHNAGRPEVSWCSLERR
jgi:hypothetical protein